MKLASLNEGQDGRLVVVSKNLDLIASAAHIAPTMQTALDMWETAAPALQALYADLNAGKVKEATPFADADFAAPLPRAWQWLDGSVFPQHADLMQKAYGAPPIATDKPLMYQGLSHRFLSATEDVPVPSEALGIDFEGELAVITSTVPMGTKASDAGKLIKLVVQINDWSLRVIAGEEMKTGFGWIQAKPACSMAPVAVTLDELDGIWNDQRLEVVLEVKRGEETFGAVLANEMAFGFDQLIEHAAATRELCPGTIIGSGTVSSSNYNETGSCCISERQAIEMIQHGERRTKFLSFGERVRMNAYEPGQSVSLFGEIDQIVVKA